MSFYDDNTQVFNQMSKDNEHEGEKVFKALQTLVTHHCQIAQELDDWRRGYAVAVKHIGHDLCQAIDAGIQTTRSGFAAWFKQNGDQFLLPRGDGMEQIDILVDVIRAYLMRVDNSEKEAR